MNSYAATADLTRLIKDLTMASHDIGKETENVLDKAANEILHEAQDIVPVKTGKLKNSLMITKTTNRRTIGPTVDYGPYVEFGTGTKGEFPTKAYEIKAKPGKTLAFSVGGNKYFVKKVIHPGIAPQAYMRPAFESWLERLGPYAADVGASMIVKGRPS